MNEELNQVQNDITEDIASSNEDSVVDSDNENLFDDYEVEDTPVEPTEEETNEETNTEVEETPQQEPYGLKIKYNGEEKVLDEETARTLAQKGMNYDRFYEPIERLARLNNMSVGDYVNRLNETQIQYEISKEINALKQNPKYENVSDEVLEEIANNRVMESIGQQDHNYEEQQREIADAQQAQVQKDIDKFMEEYPEFKNKGPEALDPQVFDFVKQGYTLLEAYNKWSRLQANINKPQLDAKEKTSRLNEENKKKSLGNTTNAGSVEVDDFLSGFLEG